MATQVKHLFVVTSAINSKFGVFSPEERLQQTLDTIASIKARIPDARIAIMECCGTPIRNDQAAQLCSASDYFFDYSQDPNVQGLYDSDNWDVVKNGTEIMVFGRVLARLHNEGHLDTVDRIHKMSGRYLLNEQFDPAMYDHEAVQDKIIIGPKYASQFPVELTQQSWQYMARLWSWPQSLTDEVISVYEDGFLFFAERVANGGYIDIEHVLAHFLNPDHVVEIANLGVEGRIAPTGTEIKN